MVEMSCGGIIALIKENHQHTAHNGNNNLWNYDHTFYHLTYYCLLMITISFENLKMTQNS